MEAKVDERLLVRFHGRQWSDENYKQEHQDYENNTSLQDTKVKASHKF